MARYKFYQSGNKTICVSTFAKHPVRGIAKCSPNDTYDEEKGYRLAQLRCDVKIAEKRLARAKKMYDEAFNKMKMADEYFNAMSDYYYDAFGNLEEAKKWLHDMESVM